MVRANVDEPDLEAEALQWTGCCCTRCLEFMKQFKNCGYRYRGSRAHPADCPFEKYRIRFMCKHWKIVLQDYLNPKPLNPKP